MIGKRFFKRIRHNGWISAGSSLRANEMNRVLTLAKDWRKRGSSLEIRKSIGNMAESSESNRGH